MSCKHALNMMDGYIDGELDLVHNLEIEEHLKQCPECSQSYERRRLLQGALKAAPLYYTPPPHLENDVRKLLRQSLGEKEIQKPVSPDRPLSMSRKQFWKTGILTALPLAMAALFFIAVWPHWTGPSSDERTTQEVIASHVRSLMVNHLTDVETSNQHVVKPWFNGKLDFSPLVKDFSDHGYPLVGGRLDYLANRPVAAIVYRRAAHPINVFIWPSKEGNSNEKTLAHQGYHLIHWSKDGMSYWLVSDLNEKELKDLADLLRA